jgi:hypothetical protein
VLLIVVSKVVLFSLKNPTLSGELLASLLKKNVPEVAIDAVPGAPMALIVNVMYSSQFLLVVEGSVIVPLDANVTAPAIIVIDICWLFADVI